MSHSDLSDAELDDADLTGADLTNAKGLIQAQLRKACGKPLSLPSDPPGAHGGR